MSVANMNIYEIARMLLARYRMDRGCKIVLAQNQVAKRTEALLSEVGIIAARIDALEAANG